VKAGTAVDESWLHKMFATIDANDWIGLADFLHPETVYERPGYEPLVGFEDGLKRTVEYFRARA